MTYRLFCDEHVEPQTVRYLERSGHEAVHVSDVLSLGIDDDAIAAYARDHGYAILTNDRGFLDDSRHPDVTVICYTDNRASAYDLAAMVEELSTYYPDQESLPRVTFLG